MNTKISEIVVLLIDVAKWMVLASLTGLLIGLSTTGVLKCLDLMIHFSSGFSWSLWLLPLGLMASAWLTSVLAPEAGGQGLERVIQAVHFRSGKIHAAVMPVKLVATILTIGTGGSAGSVGPCAQIGGGLASVFSDFCKLNDTDRKTLAICGISAGFAAVLGTPIAGAFFGVEALFVGSLAYQVLLPSVIAATVSHQVALAFGLEHWTFFLNSVSSISLSLFPWIISAGIVFGLCAILFIESMNLGLRLSLRMNLHPAIKGLIGGLLVIGLASIFSEKVLGLGLDVIHETLLGHPVIWYLFLMKIFVTSLTLNLGGSGGIILPICFVGTTAGAVLGNLFPLPIELCAALGLVGLLAGAINTPITAVLLAIELFGLPLGIYAIIVCTISFVVSGHRSAIPTQLLAIHKAPAIQTPLKEEISKSKFQIEPWNAKLKFYQSILRRLTVEPKQSDHPKSKKNDDKS